MSEAIKLTDQDPVDGSQGEAPFDVIGAAPPWRRCDVCTWTASSALVHTSLG
ncbi:MAG: hypothetical protein U5K29_04180 [Acidimicrobiales bacterium]|nr:hypothetical protein [Acidimicrobiales bacterium]